MKGAFRIVSITLICFLLSACGRVSADSNAEVKGMTWQDYYDLGIRYLSEGNYKEAIIAFTSAIAIDEKDAAAYIGRADTYVALAEGSHEDENTLSSASKEYYLKAADDYTKAIQLGTMEEDIFLKVANVYVHMKDYETASSILETALKTTESENLQTRLLEVKMKLGHPWGDDIDTLTEGEKEYVLQLLDLVESGDTESAYEMLAIVKDVMESGVHIEYNGIRLKISMMGSEDQFGGSIEIRPNQGLGYYCHYDYNKSPDYNFSKEYGTGMCSDWNWNGEFNLERHYFLDGYCEYTNHESGEMKDSLLTGEKTTDSSYTYLESGRLSENVIVDYYETGVNIDNPSENGTVYSAWGGFSDGKSAVCNWNGYYDENNIYVIIS